MIRGRLAGGLSRLVASINDGGVDSRRRFVIEQYRKKNCERGVHVRACLSKKRRKPNLIRKQYIYIFFLNPMQFSPLGEK
jgi:hypothetical protein